MPSRTKPAPGGLRNKIYPSKNEREARKLMRRVRVSSIEDRGPAVTSIASQGDVSFWVTGHDEEEAMAAAIALAVAYTKAVVADPEEEEYWIDRIRIRTFPGRVGPFENTSYGDTLPPEEILTVRFDPEWACFC